VSDSGDVYVLKRVLGSRGGPVRRSALREAYFGQLLLQRQHKLQQQQQQSGGSSSVCGGSRSLSSEDELSGHDHLVRFVEAFKTQQGGGGGGGGGDVWLAFRVSGLATKGGREGCGRNRGLKSLLDVGCTQLCVGGNT
jgi:hypothetical protein